MIEIVSRQRKRPINKNRFQVLLARLVDHYQLDNPEVTLAFVNNKTIQELNHKFLNIHIVVRVLPSVEYIHHRNR